MKKGTRIFSKDFNMKEMINNSDVATRALNLINTYLLDQPEIVSYDEKWQQLFQTLTTNQPAEKFPKKAGVSFTWKQVGPGDEPIFASTTDNGDVDIYMRKYRTAIDVDNDVFKYNNVLKVERVIDQLRESGMTQLAQIHYSLIAAAAVAAGAAGATPLAVGSFIDTQVTTMINADFLPTHIVCNIADQSYLSAAISREYRNQNLNRDLATATLPLNENTMSLELVSTRLLPAGTAYLVEAKRNLISLEDSVDTGLVIDTDLSKLYDSQQLYGKLRRGIAGTASGNIRSFTF